MGFGISLDTFIICNVLSLFTGMSSVVYGSGQWTCSDRGESGFFPFSPKKKDQHHADRKSFRWKVVFH